MQQICRNCSTPDHPHYCAHVVTTFEVGGKPLAEPKDECPHCGATSPDLTLPTEQKLWLMADVNPQEYEWKNGTRVMKDWADAELEQRLRTEDPEEVESRRRAMERKRAQAREVRTVYGNKLPEHLVPVISEAVKNGIRLAEAEESGLVLP